MMRKAVFVAETTVELLDRGPEFRLQNIDHGEVGPVAQRIVVGLRRDASPHGLGIAVVAPTDPLDAHLGGSEDGHGPIDEGIEPRLEENGAFEHDVIARLPGTPLLEIGTDRRMNQSIEIGQGCGIAKNDGCEIFTIELAVAINGIAESPGERRTQRIAPVHQSPGSGIGIVDGDAPLREKPAHGAFAAADTPGDTYADHFAAGMSISGTPSIESTLISLNCTAMALNNDLESMTIFPSWPSSVEARYLSPESGMRRVLFM